MLNIDKIRWFMKRSWNNTDYIDGLKACNKVKNDDDLYEKAKAVLERLELSNKKMNGNSLEKLPIKKQEQRASEVIYTNIFHELISGTFLSPAYYIAMVVDECGKHGISDLDQVSSITARGLLAFASFLREMDLSNKFCRVIPDAKYSSSAELDLDKHTDILLQCKEQEYRIWSYQWSTSNTIGLKNTSKRLLEGTKNKLPKGLHVLCPINIKKTFETEDVEGWKFYSRRYVKQIAKLFDGNVDNYELLSNYSSPDLMKYLKHSHVFRI